MNPIYAWTVTARADDDTDAAIVAGVLEEAIRDERNDPAEPVAVSYRPVGASLSPPPAGRGDDPAAGPEARRRPERRPEAPAAEHFAISGPDGYIGPYSTRAMAEHDRRLFFGVRALAHPIVRVLGTPREGRYLPVSSSAKVQK